MERRKEQIVNDVALAFLRESGLETPLLQYRLVQAWPTVVGEAVAARTEALDIQHEQLRVRVSSPSLISELQMRRSDLVLRLNAHVGAAIISDIRFMG